MDSFKKGLQEINAGLNRAVRTLDRMLQAIEASEKVKPAEERAPKPETKKAASKKHAAKKDKTRKPAPDKERASRPAVEKAAVKPSDADAVVGIIRRSRKGVNIPTLMKKTGFDRRKIHHLTHKAAKQGKIEQLGRGVYKKAALK